MILGSFQIFILKAPVLWITTQPLKTELELVVDERRVPLLRTVIFWPVCLKLLAAPVVQVKVPCTMTPSVRRPEDGPTAKPLPREEAVQMVAPHAAAVC